MPLLHRLNFALGAVLTSGGRQSPRTKVQIAAAIFNVCANLLIIQPYGIIGVAIVYVLTELILTVGYLAIAWPLVRQQIKRTATSSV
ncbi:MAG: polysaccharide biosynthesis C-terminal domain-containing protein [Chloroflexi bacterium]|nr:polysaccharide biosynthesis C-terminal domain-containing protein [Chloroflexota bacterium]